MNTKYSFKKGLLKALVAVIIFSVPILIDAFPAYANLTIGGVLMLIVNFLKVNYSKKI